MTITIPPFFITPLSGWLSDRFGPKLPITIGLILTIPFLILLRLPTGFGITDIRQSISIGVILTLLGRFLD